MIPRRLTNEELADLPSIWENSLVDVRNYYTSVMLAWEIDEETYRAAKADGLLVQAWRNGREPVRFYMGF